jgi:hypothetical protein
MRFWSEMLGNHLGKEKSELKKKTSSIRIVRVGNNSSDRIEGVSKITNFSDMYSEGIVILLRSSKHLKGTPMIISEELKVTPLI